MANIFDIFGGGGGGDGGAGSLDALLRWAEEEQRRLLELDEREQARAMAIADQRRGDVLDRPGYSGLVNVGDATQRSDATLAAEMGLLAEDDPMRLAYQTALADEEEQRTTNLRLTSGAQYNAEDEARRIRDALTDVRVDPFQSGGYDAAISQVESLLSEAGDLSQKYSWFEDAGSLEEELRNRLEQLRTRRERREQASGNPINDEG